jgi:hypothetical protein
MAYCSLTNDVFISYAHVDNSEGWVDKFHERLLNRLRQFDRRSDFAIWRDSKLSGADVFSDNIEFQLKSSGIFISVLSPNGLESSWCQKERQCFERVASSTGGIRLGTRSRAIRVTKTPCPGHKDRQIFGDLGYDFYLRSDQSGRFSEFHPSSPEFDAKVLDLAQEIYSQLGELRDRLQARPPDISVYVALVTSDLSPLRTRILAQLAAWNIRVPPDPPAIAQLSTSAINEAIQDCALSIHLIGPKRGMMPEDETLPLDLLELVCARSAQVDRIVCHAGEPHAGWRELPMREEMQGKEDLITDPDRMLQLIEDRIGALRKKGKSSCGILPTVYVVCSPSEFEDALRLKQCLEAEQPCAATLPIEEVEDESVRRSDHQDTLEDCEAVLIYWGALSPVNWFRDQVRDVIGARKKRSSGRLPAICLATSPSANPLRDGRPDLPLQLIPNLDCLNLRHFFRNLKIGVGSR